MFICLLRMAIVFFYDFSYLLSLIEDIIANNHGSLFLIGGDFNVNFNRVSCHTAPLDSFCTNVDLLPVIRHASSVIDYTYNFSMSRFSILDHFLLSIDLFCTSVESAFVSHSVDNCSDHDLLSSSSDWTLST